MILTIFGCIHKHGENVKHIDQYCVWNVIRRVMVLFEKVFEIWGQNEVRYFGHHRDDEKLLMVFVFTSFKPKNSKNFQVCCEGDYILESILSAFHEDFLFEITFLFCGSF